MGLLKDMKTAILLICGTGDQVTGIMIAYDSLTYLLVTSNKSETCIEGKTKRLPCPSHDEQSRLKGELIHSDISRPITPTTIKGERYFQVIVDDFSNFVLVKLLKTKDEAEEIFFVILMRQKGKNMYWLKKKYVWIMAESLQIIISKV